MAYQLTLTHEERAAIDWVGHRDRNGDELYRALWLNSQIVSPVDEDLLWIDKVDITVDVPEHVAWEVAEIIDAGLPHFAPGLVTKLQEWRGKIV